MTGGNQMIAGLEIGKCTEQWGIKIPESLKNCIDKLSATQKTELKADILLAMARACHASKFDPAEFLTD